jgi:hypothetical protein
MSFAESSKAFFDELSEMLEEQQAEKEKDLDKRTGRPYSSLLTQDEEPDDERTPETSDEEEPEVVTR